MNIGIGHRLLPHPLVSLCQLLHRLFEDGSWSSHVQAHEAPALFAEGLAIVQRQVCLIDKEVVQRLLRQSHLAAIQPHEEGSLRTDGLDLGRVLTQERIHIVDVTLYIGQSLVEPFGAVAIGCLDGGESKDMSHIELAGIHKLAELHAQVGVENQGV